VRVIVSLTLGAALHAAAFAQKPADPEARNKHAVSVMPTRPANSVQAHRSRSDATSVPDNSSSTQELAKIERTGVQQIKTTHKKTATSKPAPQAVPGTLPQTKSKPMKFSYQSPKAAGKTTSTKNPPPAAVRPGSH
jgi:hypothetical protein